MNQAHSIIEDCISDTSIVHIADEEASRFYMDDMTPKECSLILNKAYARKSYRHRDRREGVARGFILGFNDGSRLKVGWDFIEILKVESK